MGEFTYIKISISDKYFTSDNQLDPMAYEIGSTFEDYLNNKWVLLSHDLLVFHYDHPEASVKEVWEMELEPKYIPDPVEVAKEAKIKAIKDYDDSSAVNEFTVNGVITDWFTPELRSNYKNSIESAKTLGVNTLLVFIGNLLIPIDTFQASHMLAAIQLYADLCYIVTLGHLTAVKNMNNVLEIENYDYTIGYPNKLNFNINQVTEEGEEK